MSQALILAPRRRRAMVNVGASQAAVQVARVVGRQLGQVIRNRLNRPTPTPQNKVITVDNGPTRRRNRRTAKAGGAQMWAPIATTRSLRSMPPNFNGQKGCVISHTEILSEVVAANGFNLGQVSMIPNSFPWLRSFVPCFNRYVWRKLTFQFITSSPTSFAGTMAAGVSYTPLVDEPTSTAEMSSLSHAVVGPLWTPPDSTQMTISLNSASWSHKLYETWQLDNTSPVDYSSFLPGIFLYSTQSFGVDMVGYWRVSYTIEFTDPRPVFDGPDVVMGKVKTKKHKAPKTAPLSDMDKLARALGVQLGIQDEEDDEGESSGPVKAPIPPDSGVTKPPQLEGTQ